MYIPVNNETVKYLMYSTSKEIDVLYDNESFYLTFDDMLVLFKCSIDQLKDAYIQTYGKKFLKEKEQDKMKGLVTFYSYVSVLELGVKINSTEANRYSDWVEKTLKKYKQQRSEDKCVYWHDVWTNFSEEVEMYLDMDPEEGIRMEDLTNYLKRISTLFSRFIDKLIEIENKARITTTDVEYLDSIDLCFVDRVLDESTFFEFGKDIEKTIYVASLNGVVTKLEEYMGDNKDVWPDKIDSLRVKVIQMNVECKQMFYLLKRFSYFAGNLADTYENIVNPTYISHFEPEFNFWDLCADTSDVSDLSEKRKLFVDAKIKATKWLIEESSENDLKKSCEDYIERCQQSIDLIDYEISQKFNDGISFKTNMSKAGVEPNAIKLASHKKSDFVKLLSRMYDAGAFESVNPETTLTKKLVLDTFGEFLNENFQEAIDTDKSLKQPEPEITTKRSEIKPKSFPDYLLHKDKLKLAAAIKGEFSTEKGKALRLLLGALEQNEPPLIAIANRQGREIFDAIKRYFDRNIGSYQSVFDYKINQKVDKPDIDALLKRINHLLQLLEKGK